MSEQKNWKKIELKIAVSPEWLALKWDIYSVLSGICRKIAECSGYCAQIESALRISFCSLLCARKIPHKTHQLFIENDVHLISIKIIEKYD